MEKKAYWGHIFWTPGVPLPLRIVILPVEIIGMFTKPFSLMIRLFVAITAGHIVLLALISLAFIFGKLCGRLWIFSYCIVYKSYRIVSGWNSGLRVHHVLFDVHWYGCSRRTRSRSLKNIKEIRSELFRMVLFNLNK